MMLVVAMAMAAMVVVVADRVWVQITNLRFLMSCHQDSPFLGPY